MTIRVACVGAGYFSQFHYDAWARIDGIDLVAACDSDLGRADATALPAFDDLDEMLEDAAPHLLDIIVPPDAHAATIRAGLAAGVKWIICQKPFCRDLQEARSIVTEAKAADARLIVHENFRFQPWYRAIKAELESGRIGDILNATFRLRPGDGQGPDAYLDRQPYFQTMPRFLIHETGVHWIDTFRYLFGPVSHVYADLRRLNPAIKGEDAGIVLFDHTSGVRAVFDGNRHLDHTSDNLRRTMGEAWIEGTHGTLTLFGDGSVERRAFNEASTVTVLPASVWDGFGGDCVFALQSHVVRAMQTGTPLENEARDYLNVLSIKDAIYASDEAGRKLALDVH
ncbi:MAG: Gfo/Idh/MocA family oxidoreductase [Tateyamaria sp.]|uniref:Gfo/Idh/MocA family protein n=1 Tax=Tateyamaria sp. TaxID=1929288 RepID=UPI00326F4DE6